VWAGLLDAIRGFLGVDRQEVAVPGVQWRTKSSRWFSWLGSRAFSLVFTLVVLVVRFINVVGAVLTAVTAAFDARLRAQSTQARWISLYICTDSRHAVRSGSMSREPESLSVLGKTRHLDPPDQVGSGWISPKERLWWRLDAVEGGQGILVGFCDRDRWELC
jgi:hypothetical protein